MIVDKKSIQAEERAIYQKTFEAESPISILETTIGEAVASGFGQPFIRTFSLHFTNRHEDEILAASYTCSLFLSTILNRYPSYKLHTYVHTVDSQYSRILFNCKSYDKLLSIIGTDDILHILLLDKDGKAITCQCSKQDISEAFDFYTNI